MRNTGLSYVIRRTGYFVIIGDTTEKSMARNVRFRGMKIPVFCLSESMRLVSSAPSAIAFKQNTLIPYTILCLFYYAIQQCFVGT